MSQTENQIKHNEKQKAKREARRHKICYWCQKSYVDNTKRIVGKTCSKECAYNYGVFVRKTRGTYERTEEQNNRMVESLRIIRQNGGGKLSQKGIENIRAAAKIRGGDPLFGEKMKGAYMKKHGIAHWSQTKEGKEKISKIHSGKCVPIERIQSLSQKALKSQKMYSRSKKGIREDLGCFFRSTWEANYARYLNSQNVKWRYEAITYNLGLGKSYTPDFILENGTHIEIKGWLTEKSAEKIRLFQEQYPTIKLEIVDKQCYTKLKKIYQFIIENWEK